MSHFVRAIGLTHFDIVGFSLGGTIAQQIGAEHPDMVRRIILLGTGPRGGEGLAFEDLWSTNWTTRRVCSGRPSSPRRQQGVVTRLYRTVVRRSRRSRHFRVQQSAIAELTAFREWGVIPRRTVSRCSSKIRQPTLIVQGNKDVVVMPINAFLLAEHLPNAQLIIYPDSSHGAQSQHADIFLEHAKLFLRRLSDT